MTMDAENSTEQNRALQLLKKMLASHESEIDCGACSQGMECLADLVIAGASPIGAMEAVQKHIQCCRCCACEFEALVTILRSEQPSED